MSGKFYSGKPLYKKKNIVKRFLARLRFAWRMGVQGWKPTDRYKTTSKNPLEWRLAECQELCHRWDNERPKLSKDAETMLFELEICLGFRDILGNEI